MAVKTKASARAQSLATKLEDFMATYVYTNERSFFLEAETLGPWALNPTVERLKAIRHHLAALIED